MKEKQRLGQSTYGGDDPPKLSVAGVGVSSSLICFT